MSHIVQFLDRRLGYKTPKYIEVRDWRLGLVHKALQLAGLAYVFVWTILYKCQHLKDVPVSGYSRVDISTPVRDRCFEANATCRLNLRSFAELPYCLQGKARPTFEQKLCEYRDAYDLSPSAPTPNALFVPFFLSRMTQRRACEPSEVNGWHCEQTFITEAENGVSQRDCFIADIERYRLLISHSYEAGGALMGRSQSTDGALRPRVRLGGATDAEIPELEAANPDFPTLWHSPWGDEMSIADLIKLADPRGADIVLATKGEDGLQRRERGGVLAVSIEYTNAEVFDIFAQTQPHYVVSARLLPMQWFYQSHAVPHQRGDRRHLEAYQGLLVTVRVHGSVRVFDLLQLVQVLTTSVVVLALAGIITDTVMVHCTDLAQRYQLLQQPGLQEEGANGAREERPEQRLDAPDGLLTRNKAGDVAGACLQELATELVGVGSARVAPL